MVRNSYAYGEESVFAGIQAGKIELGKEWATLATASET